MTIGTAKARAERDDDGATAEEGVTVSQLVEASLVEASQTTPARPGPASGGGHGRRGFSAAYKLAILEEYERLDEPGAKGVLLRREGLYSSHIVEWRHARAGGPFAGLEPKVTTGKKDATHKEVERLARKVERLEDQLRRHKEALEVQGKASELLARLLAEGTERVEQQPKRQRP